MNKQAKNPPEANPRAFKHFFGKELLKRMSDAISRVYLPWDPKPFLALITELETLEMKPRVRCLRDELRRQLPEDYVQARRILLESARGGTLNGFDLWPYSEFVQTYGLEDLKLSLDALRELTPLFSSEFAVRPYLKRYPAETLRYLEKCARDKNVDLRRWASEGTRPRLPWGERLQEFVEDPSPSFPILELLKFDSELYVRKSVSNHLNDIAKDHPQRVIRLLTSWDKSAGTPDDKLNVEWIIRRALRTLIKDGHPEALKLIGVSRDAKFKLSGLKLNQGKFRLGEKIEFGFKIRSLSHREQKLVVDYIVHFVRANQRTSPKVFKLKTVVLRAGGEVIISKSHSLREVTTRAHYPGVHFLEIQVNGRGVGRVKWELLGE